MKLVDCQEKDECVVIGTTAEGEELAKLWKTGINEGAEIKVVKFLAGKTMLVTADGAYVALGKKIAEKVEVALRTE